MASLYVLLYTLWCCTHTHVFRHNVQVHVITCVADNGRNLGNGDNEGSQVVIASVWEVGRPIRLKQLQ